MNWIIMTLITFRTNDFIVVICNNIMKWNKLYNYPPSTRSTTDGIRTYGVGEEKLPSVTTILSATQPKKTGIFSEMEGVCGRGASDKNQGTSSRARN